MIGRAWKWKRIEPRRNGEELSSQEMKRKRKEVTSRDLKRRGDE